MNVTPKRGRYIESHLNREFSLAAIAEADSVSRFQLSRAFAVSTGTSLAGYMRARGLSETAGALVQGARDLLSVALDAGYNSREAFTLAFRQHSGLTPERLWAQAVLAGIALQEPIRMIHQTDTGNRIARRLHLGLIGRHWYHAESKCRPRDEPVRDIGRDQWAGEIGTVRGRAEAGN